MIVLFELFFNFYQGFLMVFFMKMVLPLKKSTRIMDIVSVICISGFFTVCQYTTWGIPDTLCYFFPFLYAVCTKRGTWLQRILWALIFAGVMDGIILGMAALFLNHPQGDMIMQTSTIRFGFVISTNLVLTIAYLVIAKLNRRFDSIFLDFQSFLILIVIFLAAVAAMEFLYYYQWINHANENLLLYVYLCMFGLVLLVLLLYYIINRNARSRNQTEMQLQTMAIRADHQQDISAIYHDMLVMQHDMKHQVNAIRQMIQASADVDKEALMSLLQSRETPVPLYMTGCTVADAILTAKHSIMAEKHIQFDFQPYPLQNLPLDDTSFCILLSNILDNAIEGVQRITDADALKEIKLSFARSWSMFYLTCSNPVQPQSIRRENDCFVTSKKENHMHGLGLESIRQIAKENQGECDISIKDGWFTVAIVLPDKEKTPA